MRAVRDLADQYLRARCALDPQFASSLGLGDADSERRLTDPSPAGLEARAELQRRTLAETDALAGNRPVAAIQDGDERRCLSLLRDRLSVGVATYDAGEESRPLRIIGSNVGAVRAVFDNMSKATDDDWSAIVARMAAVPAALDGVRATLDEGRRRGILAARRQALAVATQAATWAGLEHGPRAEATPWFAALAAQAPPILRDDADRAGAAATEAFAGIAAYLREAYAGDAPESDAVGRDRYVLSARQFLGAELDADDAYAYGWDELRRIEADMLAVGRSIVADAGSIREVCDHLDVAGPAIEGDDVLRNWLQELMDATMRDLGSRHFEIPEPVRRIEAMIAPPGSAAAQYYTGPSADFARPGRTWYPTMGASRFPLWAEVSTAYHEGVPGHHLQIAQWAFRASAAGGSALSQFQRAFIVSGNIEGWALYAERLMHELGYLDDPSYRFGYLRAQLLRAVRVVVDIGFHCGLVNPETGRVWEADAVREFLLTRTADKPEFMASEMVRYFGWPGQAICYKLGERAWLAGRAAARAACEASGSTFDLRRFHADALDQGSLGLTDLAAELALAGVDAARPK